MSMSKCGEREGGREKGQREIKRERQRGKLSWNSAWHCLLQLLFLTLEGIRPDSAVHFHRVLHKCSLYYDHVAVLYIILVFKYINYPFTMASKHKPNNSSALKAKEPLLLWWETGLWWFPWETVLCSPLWLLSEQSSGAMLGWSSGTGFRTLHLSEMQLESSPSHPHPNQQLRSHTSSQGFNLLLLWSFIIRNM